MHVTSLHIDARYLTIILTIYWFLEGVKNSPFLQKESDVGIIRYVVLIYSNNPRFMELCVHFIKDLYLCFRVCDRKKENYNYLPVFSLQV